MITVVNQLLCVTLLWLLSVTIQAIENELMNLLLYIQELKFFVKKTLKIAAVGVIFIFPNVNIDFKPTDLA